MMHIVQIKPSGYLLFVVDGETVLQAAIRQGYEFPYSCSSGTCGTCIGKVLSGNYHYGDVKPYALDDIPYRENSALFCSVRPSSDMIIEVEEVYGPEFLAARKTEYTVHQYQILNNHIYQVILTPKSKPITYHAGQYLKITCNDGVKLPFSITNAPSNHRHLELQIKAMPDNPHTSEIIAKIKAKEVLQLQGPYGKVIYRNEPKLPIIFVAGGTGIAPLKAIIEQALTQNDPRSLHLFWGGQHPDALYLSEHIQAYAKNHDNFSFTPVVDKKGSYWHGATGLVHEAVIKEYDDLSGYQVYASGPTPMVYAALDAFTNKGLKPQLLFSDTFEHAPR